MTNSEKMVRKLQSLTAKRGQEIAQLEFDLDGLKADLGLIRALTPFEPSSVLFRVKGELRRRIRALAYDQKVDRIALKAIHANRRHT